jgi:hypothetical protein
MRLNLSRDCLINKSFLFIDPRLKEVDQHEGDLGEPFGAIGAVSKGRMMQPAGNAEGGLSGRLLAFWVPGESASGQGDCFATEREGFEPSRELAPPTRLAGECLQPLGHLSTRWTDCRY